MKTLNSDALRGMFPPPSRDFAARSADALRRIAAQERAEGREAERETKKTALRKKPVFCLALALLLALCAFGALAATLDWGVLDFLFGGRDFGAKREGDIPARAIVQVVDAEAGDGRVSLRISGAVTDGETLAFDWAIRNAEPETPVFVAVEAFTGNGARLSTDGADDFHLSWLPGVWAEDGAMQGGNLCALPDAVRGADALDVFMTVGVYRPLAPVYDFGFEEFDAALALEKLDAGEIVAGEGDCFAVRDAAAGAALVRAPGRGVPEALLPLFERTAFTVNFSLDMARGRAQVCALDAEEAYAGGAARYTRATVSPLGLTLELDLFDFDPKLGFELVLTDGDGQPLEAPWPEGEIVTLEGADGARYHHARFAWYGLTEDLLPDVVSLTRVNADGGKEVFPARVRGE